MAGVIWAFHHHIDRFAVAFDFLTFSLLLTPPLIRILCGEWNDSGFPR